MIVEYARHYVIEREPVASLEEACAFIGSLEDGDPGGFALLIMDDEKRPLWFRKGILGWERDHPDAPDLPAGQTAVTQWEPPSPRKRRPIPSECSECGARIVEMETEPVPYRGWDSQVTYVPGPTRATCANGHVT